MNFEVDYENIINGETKDNHDDGFMINNAIAAFNYARFEFGR